MKKDLTFSGYFMTVLNDHITIDNFKKSIPTGEYNYQHEGVYYTFDFEYDGDLLFISMDHGSPLPLPEHVVNIETLEKENNPRTENLYEPKQTFAFIDFNTGYIWLSNTHKKIVMWVFFTEKFKTPQVSIREVYDEQKFLETLVSVDDIKFSATPHNLFSSTSTLSQELSNELLGYGGTQAIIQIKYHNTFVGDTIKDKLLSLFRNKAAFRSLVVTGKDSKGAMMKFNTDAIIRKIIIKTELELNGTFNSDRIFEQIKGELSKI